MESSGEQRIGPYRVEREIGRGGMGVVYLASRSDNAYYKQVAIKLLHANLQNEEVVRRFRSERQILASLEHPNIARLLDGGTTDSGEPYIVMEYVRSAKGLRRYAIDAELTIRQRLELFLVVCRAVQHAHQHLVIHRDLKPSNILVTSEGEVKLVDFGIAKLLLPSFWPHDSPQTMTGMQAMTPEYASPEQIRGGSISVASDVYTLGVVLYELLSGELPFRRTDDAHVLSLLQQVLEKEPTKPSVAAADSAEIPLRRELEGDLDNIILMAIRKEPEKRYQSAEQLAGDIQRYLDGRPVVARAATLQYRAMKFAQRNRASLAAAALIVLSLVGGIIATSREADVAEQQRILAQQEAAEASKQRERAEQLAKLEQASRSRAEEKAREAEQQAALAQAQTKLADARFNAVREIATNVIFKLEAEIRHLPGSTPARKKIVENARTYLDQLYETSQNHAELQHQLASAYVQLSRIQRAPSQSNLGDSAGAAHSLKRGLELARRSLELSPSLVSNYGLISAALAYQGDLLALEGKLQAAIPLFEQSLVFARKSALSEPDDLLALRYPLTSLTKLAEAFREMGRTADAERYLRDALAIASSNARRFSDQAVATRDLMVALNRLAHHTLNHGNVAESRALVEQITPLLDTLEKAAGGASLLRERMLQEVFLARVAERENDWQRAAQHYRVQVSLNDQILERDPKNYLAILDTVFGLIHLGETLPKIDRAAEGIPFLRRAVLLSDGLTAIDAKSVQTYQARMNSRKELAGAMDAAKQPEAAHVYREMLAIIEKDMPAGQGPFVDKTAQALSEAGDYFLERQPPDGRTAHQAYSRAADLYRQLKSDKEVQELTALMQKAAPPK
ncbi:MAG: protein kinase [Bryobacterales bacterium]|nr:protein kinase [Bryobacterales bacterium]